MTTQTKTRRSRWKKPPRLKADGTKKKRTVTQNDEEIFKLLTPGFDLRRPWGYSMLRSNYISALLEREHTSTLESLDALAADGYLYLPDQPINNFRHLIYGNADKASKHLDQPKVKHSHLIKHELLRNDIAGSFEITARMHGFDLLSWPAIYSSDQFPQKTRDQKDPTAIPVGNSYIRADWKPFVIRTGKQFHFILGFEADAASKPVYRSDTSQSSLSEQLEHYLAFIDRRTYRTHFGANSAFIPFVLMEKLDEPERLQNVMDELARIIERRGYPKSYAKHFGFKEVPSFYKKPMPPTDWAANGWKRVHHPDFSLIEE